MVLTQIHFIKEKMMSGVIIKIREEIANKISQLEVQNNKHMDDIKSYERKIIQAKDKQNKLQQHLDHERNELHKIDEYLKWSKE